MKLLDFLAKEAILEGLASEDKKGILEELAAPVAKAANTSHENLVKVLMEREQLGSTGIGGGIGIPHGKSKQIDSLVIGFGRSRKGVDFESMDGKPTYIFFLIITPDNSTSLHLKVLARISRLLKSESFKEGLLSAADKDEIYEIIKMEDEDF
jgi:PTS system nitrogen regulatory IIA component